MSVKCVPGLLVNPLHMYMFAMIAQLTRVISSIAMLTLIPRIADALLCKLWSGHVRWSSEV